MFKRVQKNHNYVLRGGRELMCTRMGKKVSEVERHSYFSGLEAGSS